MKTTHTPGPWKPRAMKQTQPFSVVFGPELKDSLHALAKEKGVPYGVFFSTSGRALIEQVNDSAKHGYIFRTDRDI